MDQAPQPPDDFGIGNRRRSVTITDRLFPKNPPQSTPDAVEAVYPDSLKIFFGKSSSLPWRSDENIVPSAAEAEG
jgi:hypothetical protein